MRTVTLFNHDWLFYPDVIGDNTPDKKMTPVTLPHTNKVLPYQGFHDNEYQFISTYRKRFRLPEPLNGRRLYLDFDGAMLALTLTINGHTFPEHRGGYVPFSFDITNYVNETGENVITIQLDSRERADIPPFGYVVDYLAFGGIYRDVFLRYVNPIFIENIHIRTHNVLTNQPHISAHVHVRNTGDFETLTDILLNCPELGVNGLRTRVAVSPRSSQEFVVTANVQDMQLWTLDNPQRYEADIRLNCDDAPVDQYPVKFGFREAIFKHDGFYLNGERVQLRGLNRHQTYPYIGAAAPERLQRKDADIIKHELSCNIVRTSHYPQSRYFIDQCDAIGLLVFEEIPGWQFIGADDWKTLSLRDVRAMIERDWNSPSIILWGVRVNESWDDDAFYKATNALAHELDPTRQTGGVRFFQESHFLEDVFTYNDFSNGVVEPVHTPYMITEFNGHMFPTKTFDNEERRIEHALRHARIQSQAATMGGVSGAIGWCAFDYNTHKEFGSGDRICYHGVMDIFRLPKYAARLYESQVSPDERIVLRAGTLWSMGDRSGGGNNPLMIFTNCDAVDVHAGDEYIGRFTPDHDNYPNLPHPPITVEGLGMRWGAKFGDLHVIGYLNEEVVAEQRIECDAQADRLLLVADDDQLRADGMDMTRVVFKIIDRHGNPLPYLSRVVSFEIVEGQAELVGDNPFALIGGQAALYLRAANEPSTVRIRATTPRLAPAEITIEIV